MLLLTQGSRGAAGVAGEAGAQGYAGLQGSRGSDGARGARVSQTLFSFTRFRTFSLPGVIDLGVPFFIACLACS